MTHTRSLILATAVFALAGCFGENPLQPSEEGARPLVGVHASAAAGDLGTLGGNTSTAHDINASGQIVGYSETSSGVIHAFYWQNGTMTDMGTLGGANSYAFGISDGGHIVGVSANASGNDHAFLWLNGSMRDLGPLSSACYDYSYANAVNANGQR